MANDPEHQSLSRELAHLRERLAAVERAQADEMAALRAAIDALESKLAPAAAEPEIPVFDLPESGPPLLPDPAQEPQLPAFVESKPPSPPTGTARPRRPPAAFVESKPPAPPAILPPSPAPEGSFELRFGRVWLVRLGIALLVTGLVLLGNFAYRNWIRDLPAGVRLAALYLGSGLLSGAGIYLGRRETTRRFADVLLAGGLAFFYWCTFASHHVPRLRVVESPVIAGVFLLLAAGVIVAVSLRRDSRATAVMGLLLASYSTVLQPLGWLSAVSNVVLAAAGTGLMLRPGWATPGIASMTGTYLAFLWWQIAGGHGGRPEDPAALWFLPPVWAVFALPGVLGISQRFSGLTERGRTWFAAANNAAFFALFSLLWFQQRSGANYWMVPAIFGAVLLALGIAGRSRDPAGGIHLAQGLGALTLAMALKLEGYHLPLGFAVQAFALSIAFRRFGGKSELGFTALAAALAAALSVNGDGLASDVPLWSRAVVALLLIAAAFPLRNGCDRLEPQTDKARAARAATSLVFMAGSALALVFCGHHLQEIWRAPATQAIALGFSAFTLLKDPARRLPEAAWVVIAFGIACLGFLTHASSGVPWWPAAVAGALALAGHALWIRRVETSAKPTIDPLTNPQIFHWLTALTVTASIHQAVPLLRLSPPLEMISFALAAVAIAATGRHAIKSTVLQVAAALLLPKALILQSQLHADAGLLQFIPAAAALGIAAFAGPRSLAGVLARIAAVVSWLFAWNQLAPETWGDIIAASGLLIAIFSSRRKAEILPETWAFLAIAVLRVLARCAFEPWQERDPAPFPHGWLTVAACFTTVLLMRPANVPQKGIRHGLLLAACALLALWSSQVVVWHFDWKPVAILWTILGFALVSAGLWQKLSALRHAGFALLTLSLGKLFAVDIWDFGAFTRVAAFLALGVALVVLGFFYNRFAEVLKKLFESDGG